MQSEVSDRKCESNTYKEKNNLVVVGGLQEAKNEQEKVQNVQVQCDGSWDLIIEERRLHEHLSVHQDVPTENERSKRRIESLDGWRAVRNEHEDKAATNESPQTNDEHPLQATKVILCLESESRKANKHQEGDQNGLHQNITFNHGTRETDSISLTESETTQ